MRIQHNIMAMNAYRNYTNNVSAMKKNLEKLSSGYKINRAGDDAAGLAISEKMRAQITGLQTAQKNAKDGISLVQTAEGALTEVHDMLNRMVELATQSANGTYDDSVDRNQMQKEVNQLLEEIDRIADSSNFNGINLLDGTLGLNKTAFSEITPVDAKVAGPVNGAFTWKTAGADINSNTILHADGVKASGSQFVIDLNGLNVENPGAGKTAKVKIQIGDASFTVSASATNTGLTAAAIASKLKAVLTGGANGGLAINKDGDVVSADAKGSTGALKYTVTASGGKLTLKATSYAKGGAWTALGSNDANGLAKFTSGVASAAAQPLAIKIGAVAVASANGKVNIEHALGIENVINGAKPSAAKLAHGIIEIDWSKVQDGMELKIDGESATLKLDKNSTFTGKVIDLSDYDLTTADGKKQAAAAVGRAYAGGTTNLEVGHDKDGNLTLTEKGKTGVTPTESAITTAEQKKLSTLSGFQAKLELRNTDQNAKTSVKIDEGAINEGDTLTIDGKKYTFVNDTTKVKDPAKNTTYLNIAGAAANLKNALGANATESNGVVTYKAATKDDPAPVILGRGLTLQIGDTSDGFNQLNVAVQDMHSKSLGIEGLSIKNEVDAQKAIKKIKDSINTVSDVRGTLGATQNRLDHTINNLSVMTENIQDAESTIRDTDVAEEMMAYTKNNILIQSAQAMLAQANQVPQGVLQLLQ